MIRPEISGTAVMVRVWQNPRQANAVPTNAKEVYLGLIQALRVLQLACLLSNTQQYPFQKIWTRQQVVFLLNTKFIPNSLKWSKWSNGQSEEAVSLKILIFDARNDKGYAHQLESIT